MYILGTNMYILGADMYILGANMYHKGTNMQPLGTKVYLLKRYSPSDSFFYLFFWECNFVAPSKKKKRSKTQVYLKAMSHEKI